MLFLWSQWKTDVQLLCVSLLGAPQRMAQVPLGVDDLSRGCILLSAPGAAACQICLLVLPKQHSSALSSRRGRRETHVRSLGAAVHVYSLAAILTE